MTISVIDIGTSSIKTLMANTDDNVPNIIGFSNVSHTGVRKSNIVDIEATISAINRSITEAELMAGEKVSNLKVSIGGENVIKFQAQGMAVIRNSSGITPEDVMRSIEQTKAGMNMDNIILHTLPISFTIDNQDDIKNPVGLTGQQLTTQTFIVGVPSNVINNFSRTIEGAGYRYDEFILQHLAASQSVLDTEEKELGVALVDIGAGTTKIAIYINDALRYVDTINIGGDNITQDLSIGLRTPRKEAEKIKIEYGYCIKDIVDTTKEIIIPGVNQREDKKMTIENVVDIIGPRTIEIMEFIRESLENSTFMRQLNTGIVLTGGSSLLKGIKEVGERQLELPVKIGYPEKLSGVSEHIDSPEYSVAIGMLLYAFDEEKNKYISMSHGRNTGDSIKKFLQNLKDIIKL